MSQQWPCPLLNTGEGELALHPHGRAIPPLTMGICSEWHGLGELVQALAWGSSPSGPWPAQLPPRPSSWALGWPILISPSSTTSWREWMAWSTGSPMTEGNSRISQCVPEALNQTKPIAANNLQVGLTRQEGILHDTLQIPVRLGWLKRSWEDKEKSRSLFRF